MLLRYLRFLFFITLSKLRRRKKYFKFLNLNKKTLILKKMEKYIFL